MDKFYFGVVMNFRRKVAELYVDGTFLVNPVLFYQFFVILVRRDDYVFPILYCLLPNKTENTYRFFTIFIR